MEISFKKSLDKSYMVVDTEESRDGDYTIRMLTENRPDGFCPVDAKSIDGKTTYYYDISHKESLKCRYKYGKMTKKDIVKLFAELKSATDTAKKYLLNPEKIVMKMDYIYNDMISKKLCFCYYPCKKEDYYESIRMFMDELIRYIDHSDKPTVIMAYGIHQLVQSENVTLADMLKFVNSSQFMQQDGEYRMPFEDDSICILKNNDYKEVLESGQEANRVSEEFKRKKKEILGNLGQLIQKNFLK